MCAVFDAAIDETAEVAGLSAGGTLVANGGTAAHASGSRVDGDSAAEEAALNTEELVRAYATLAFTHSMTTAGVPPRRLRSILQGGLARFPVSRAVCAGWAESRHRIPDAACLGRSAKFQPHCLAVVFRCCRRQTPRC